MQNLIIGMWSKRKETFSLAARWIFSRHVPTGGMEAPRQRIDVAPSRGTFRMGRVWLMIGKPQLKRQDKVGFAPEAACSAFINAQKWSLVIG
jgi:hypothetical protein